MDRNHARQLGTVVLKGAVAAAAATAAQQQQQQQQQQLLWLQGKHVEQVKPFGTLCVFLRWHDELHNDT